MNVQRSTPSQLSGSTQWIAVFGLVLLVALTLCSSASAARVVNLPSSGNAADPQLAMTDSGAYAITWRQQPTFGEFERVYAQTGTLSRPFKSKPVSPGLVKNLTGPLATVATSGRDGLAWIGGVDAGASVRFFGPASTKARTVAWIEAEKIVRVAKLTKAGRILSLLTAHMETSAAALSGAQVRVDRAGNPTVLWSREAIECVPPLTFDDGGCFPAAVFAATANAAGGFDPAQLIANDCESAQLVEAPSGAATTVLSCGTKLRVSHRTPGLPFTEPVELPMLGAQEAGSVSIALRKGSSVVVAFETANSFDSQTVRANLLLASGPIGQTLSTPRRVRSGIRFESANSPRPTPKLVVTKSGRIYLRWLERRRTKIALVKSALRLGRSMTVPGYDRRGLNTMDAEVSITDRGRALAVWNFISIKISPAVRATTFAAPTK